MLTQNAQKFDSSVKKNCEIRDYGLIGNSRTAALVSKTGSIDWACFPHFDSSSLFCSLLDPERGGHFSIHPARSTSQIDSHQTYITDTNILETRFSTPSGQARLLDCFTVTSQEDKHRHLLPDEEILRVLEGVEGETEFELELYPRTYYGKQGVRFKKLGDWGLKFEWKQRQWVFQGSVNFKNLEIISDQEGDRALLRFSIKAGERCFFSLIFSDQAPSILAPLGQAAMDRLNETERYWRSWISQCQYEGPYRSEIRRSAFVLKLLTFAPSGAIVAAPTTSLPEAIGGGRNWDYRFCWLRDASFTVRSLLSLGYIEDAKVFTAWLLHTTRLTRPELQVVYSVYGRSELKEKELTWLSGYAGSQPVRIGNAASEQFQLDIYGELLDSFYSVLPHLSRLDRETEMLLQDLGKTVLAKWRMPDDGIWEYRMRHEHHTHSQVLAWVALDRLHKIGLHQNWPNAGKYCDAAAELRIEIETRGFDEKQNSYVRSYESQDLDAAVLVMPLLGYCDPKSPRILGTIKRIQERLSKNGLIYRYLPESDGMQSIEGSFGICNFWMVQTLTMAGKLDEAQFWLDSTLKWKNSQGLWAEELDPETGAFLGNYPQAFTHIGLIQAALTLAEAKKEAIAA